MSNEVALFEGLGEVVVVNTVAIGEAHEHGEINMTVYIKIRQSPGGSKGDDWGQLPINGLLERMWRARSSTDLGLWQTCSDSR
jgi:hypothetical protein